MKKPKKICQCCRKVKGVSCICKPKEAYKDIKKTNYKLYNSSKWRKYAHAFRRENPLCKMCLDEGRTTPSEMVDHVKEINKGGSIWDESNHQCLCNNCHAKKSGRASKK